MTKEDPGVRGDGINDDQEGLKAVYGRDIKETEIHMKSSAFDIQYQIGSRTIGNCLTLGTERTDRATEIFRDVNFQWKTLNGALMNHALGDIDANTTMSSREGVADERERYL